MSDIKEDLINEIKELLKINDNDKAIDINPNYLKYFDEDELKDIVFRLIDKRVEHIKGNSTYLDEIYLKTKKDDKIGRAHV